MKKYRIAKCKHTKQLIVQVKDGTGWLCLHKETEMEDKMSVQAFRAGRGY